MKTVNKYIMASCVFCYFAGIYLIASKLGFLRIINQYGISRIMDEWPADLPSLKFVYICLAIYTIIFAIITYIIYRNIESHGKDMEALQQKTSTIHNYSEVLALAVSRYNRVCREKNISNKIAGQKLQLLEKQVSSLPASVLNDSNAGDKIAHIVSEIDAAISNMDSSAESDLETINTKFRNLVESGIEDIQRLRANNINLKST